MSALVSEHAIGVYNGLLTLDGDFTLLSVGGNTLIAMDGLTLKGDISVKGSKCVSAIYSQKYITILGGKIHACSSKDAMYCPDGKVAIYGNTEYVLLQSGKDYEALSAHAFEIINAEGQNLQITQPFGAYFSSNDETILSSQGLGVSRLLIGNLYLYNLYVGNTQVTSDNKNDILRDGGKAKFNPETNTLTLNDPIIPDYMTASEDLTVAICASDMDLIIKGKYKMTEATTKHGLNITRGSLMLDGDFVFCGTTCGIFVDNNVTFSGKIVVSSSEAPLYCPEGTLTINSNTESVTLQSSGNTKAFVASDFVLGNGLKVEEPVNWMFFPEKKTIGDIDKNLTADRVVIRHVYSILSGNGTADSPYQIKSTADWNNLAENVRYGYEIGGKYFQLANDITVSTMMGTADHPFNGIFDGLGHTLTFDINNDNTYAAPFNYISAATIKNLKTAGTVVSSGAYSSGFVGYAVDGTNLIENCVIGTNVAAGSSYAGGVLGYVKKEPKIILDGCVFTGNVYNKGTMTGALRACTLVGYVEAANDLTMHYCLDASSSNKPTGRGSWPLTSDHIYFTTAGKSDYNEAGNRWSTGKTPVIPIAVAPANIGVKAKEYSFMTEYANGMKYGGKYYVTTVGLYDAASNADLLSDLTTTYSNQSVDVTLTGRTLTRNNEWNTLCLPFNVDNISTSPLAGATIKELDADGTNLSDDGKLMLRFKAATSIEAGKPYLIKWETADDNIVNPVFTGVTISSTAPTAVTSNDGKATFVGQYSPFEITADNIDEIILMSTGNRMGYSKAARTLKCFRCHFYVPNEDGAEAPVRSFVLDFGEEGEATDISATLNDKGKMRNEKWWTLDGRMLEGEPTVPGIYIYNGRKVVIQ